jgi:hypothetical protein
VVFAIYIDSFLFVFATSVLKFGFGVEYSASACEAAILLCLTCYVTSKVLNLLHTYCPGSEYMLTILVDIRLCVSDLFLFSFEALS